MSALHKGVVQRQLSTKIMDESHNANCKQMEGDRPLHPALAHANKLIEDLVKDILPETPYLLTVPTKTPYRPTFPHEHVNSPFGPDEQHLQYMTFLQDGHRGVMVANGSWQEDMEGATPNSAAVRSSTGTPNPKDPKKPSQKISFSDYKKFKESGVTPTFKPVGPTLDPSTSRSERNGSHERTFSSTSLDNSTSWGVQPEENAEVRVNGAKTDSTVKAERYVTDNRPIVQQPHSKDAVKTGSIARGSATKSIEATKSKVISRPNEDVLVENNIQHKLPPRPRSPPHTTTDGNSHKRSREHEELLPDKRMKTDDVKASSAKLILADSDGVLKTKLIQPVAAVNGINHAKPSESKLSVKPSTDKLAVNLPPFHSPLPQDIAAYAEHTEPYDTQTDANQTATQPANGHGAKHGNSRTDSANSSTLSTPPRSSPIALTLPELLSPTLPDIYEQGLRKPRTDHGKTTPLLTVEGRHDKARQFDSSGVARKIKVGHPPKRRSDESSNSIKSRDPSRDSMQRKRSLIVKIPVKKRLRQGIERLLQLPAKPSKEFRSLEAERLAGMQGSIVVASPKDRVKPAAPASDTKQGSLTKVSSAKKRMHEGLTPEPAAKRAKIPKSIDIPKASTPAPAFKSPVTSSFTPQKLLATPKKGDIIKSTGTRRVDSAEDNDVRTPKTNITSTPASAGKPRINGEVHRQSPEVEQLIQDYEKYNALARTLKHARDPIVKDLPSTHTDSERLRTRAAFIGIESLISWMISFEAQDKINATKGKRDASMWESLIKYLHDVERHTVWDKVLNAVMSNLAALCCEVCEKQLLYSVTGDVKTVLEKVKDSERNRSKYWKRADETKGCIAEVVAEVKSETHMGPWTTDMRYAGRWALAILEKWEAEKNCGWKRELEF